MPRRVPIPHVTRAAGTGADGGERLKGADGAEKVKGTDGGGKVEGTDGGERPLSLGNDAVQGDRVNSC